MGDVLDLHDPESRIATERARVVQGLRALADRIEAAPRAKLLEAVPAAAWALDDLERRIGSWLR